MTDIYSAATMQPNKGDTTNAAASPFTTLPISSPLTYTLPTSISLSSPHLTSLWSSSTPFTFRRRTIPYEFSSLFALDLDTIVKERDLTTLQRYTNTLTYGDIRTSDLHYFSSSNPDSLSNTIHLIRTYQLSMESILYIQSFLIKSIQAKEGREAMIQEKLKERAIYDTQIVRELRDHLAQAKEELRKKEEVIEGYQRAGKKFQHMTYVPELPVEDVKSTSKYHIQSTYPGEIFTCDYCQNSFISLSYLTAHVKRRHTGKEQSKRKSMKKKEHEEEKEQIDSNITDTQLSSYKQREACLQKQLTEVRKELQESMDATHELHKKHMKELEKLRQECEAQSLIQMREEAKKLQDRYLTELTQLQSFSRTTFSEHELPSIDMLEIQQQIYVKLYEEIERMKEELVKESKRQMKARETVQPPIWHVSKPPVTVASPPPPVIIAQAPVTPLPPSTPEQPVNDMDIHRPAPLSLSPVESTYGIYPALSSSAPPSRMQNNRPAQPSALERLRVILLKRQDDQYIPLTDLPFLTSLYHAHEWLPTFEDQYEDLSHFLDDLSLPHNSSQLEQIEQTMHSQSTARECFNSIHSLLEEEAEKIPIADEIIRMDEELGKRWNYLPVWAAKIKEKEERDVEKRRLEKIEADRLEKEQREEQVRLEKERRLEEQRLALEAVNDQNARISAELARKDAEIRRQQSLQAQQILQQEKQQQQLQHRARTQSAPVGMDPNANETNTTLVYDGPSPFDRISSLQVPATPTTPVTPVSTNQPSSLSTNNNQYTPMNDMNGYFIGETSGVRLSRAPSSASTFSVHEAVPSPYYRSASVMTTSSPSGQKQQELLPPFHPGSRIMLSSAPSTPQQPQQQVPVSNTSVMPARSPMSVYRPEGQQQLYSGQNDSRTTTPVMIPSVFPNSRGSVSRQGSIALPPPHHQVAAASPSSPFSLAAERQHYTGSAIMQARRPSSVLGSVNEGGVMGYHPDEEGRYAVEYAAEEPPTPASAFPPIPRTEVDEQFEEMIQPKTVPPRTEPSIVVGGMRPGSSGSASASAAGSPKQQQSGLSSVQSRSSNQPPLHPIKVSSTPATSFMLSGSPTRSVVTPVPNMTPVHSSSNKAIPFFPLQQLPSQQQPAPFTPSSQPGRQYLSSSSANNNNAAPPSTPNYPGPGFTPSHSQQQQQAQAVQPLLPNFSFASNQQQMNNRTAVASPQQQQQSQPQSFHTPQQQRQPQQQLIEADEFDLSDEFPMSSEAEAHQQESSALAKAREEEAEALGLGRSSATKTTPAPAVAPASVSSVPATSMYNSVRRNLNNSFEDDTSPAKPASVVTTTAPLATSSAVTSSPALSGLLPQTRMQRSYTDEYASTSLARSQQEQQQHATPSPVENLLSPTSMLSQPGRSDQYNHYRDHSPEVPDMYQGSNSPNVSPQAGGIASAIPSSLSSSPAAAVTAQPALSSQATFLSEIPDEDDEFAAPSAATNLPAPSPRANSNNTKSFSTPSQSDKDDEKQPFRTPQEKKKEGLAIIAPGSVKSARAQLLGSGFFMSPQLSPMSGTPTMAQLKAQRSAREDGESPMSAASAASPLSSPSSGGLTPSPLRAKMKTSATRKNRTMQSFVLTPKGGF